jgi:O-antigen/teichoic acid export membrane protein
MPENFPEVIANSQPAIPIEAGEDVPELRKIASGLLRGSAVYGITSFCLKSLSFLLLALYTRFLTPADYGKVSLAEILAVVVAAVCGLGLDGAMRRLYFEYKDQAAVLRLYIGSVLRFAFGFSVVSVSLAFVAGPRFMSWIAPHYQAPFFPYVALSIGAAAAQQLVEYRSGLYQVQEQVRSFALLSFSVFLLTAASVVFLVVFLRWGAEGMLLGKLAGGLGSACIAVILLREYLSAGLQLRFVKETLSLGLPLVPHQLLALGLVVADRFILQRYRSLTEVGIYSVAYTFGMVMYLVAAALSQAWSPMFYDLARKGGRANLLLARISSLVFLMLTGIGILGCLIAQDFIHRFLDIRYYEAGRLIPWIIGGYLLHAMFSLLQLPMLQAKSSIYLWAVSFVAVTANIGLNFLWVPRLGMYGAAYATLGAYGIEVALMYIYAQSVFPLPYRKLQILGGLALFAGVLGLTQLHWSDSRRLLVFGSGLLISSLLLLLLGGRDLKEAIPFLTKGNETT